MAHIKHINIITAEQVAHIACCNPSDVSITCHYPKNWGDAFSANEMYNALENLERHYGCVEQGDVNHVKFTVAINGEKYAINRVEDLKSYQAFRDIAFKDMTKEFIDHENQDVKNLCLSYISCDFSIDNWWESVLESIDEKSNYTMESDYESGGLVHVSACQMLDILKRMRQALIKDGGLVHIKNDDDFPVFNQMDNFPLSIRFIGHNETQETSTVTHLPSVIIIQNSFQAPDQQNMGQLLRYMHRHEGIPAIAVACGETTENNNDFILSLNDDRLYKNEQWDQESPSSQLTCFYSSIDFSLIIQYQPGWDDAITVVQPWVRGTHCDPVLLKNNTDRRLGADCIWEKLNNGNIYRFAKDGVYSYYSHKAITFHGKKVQTTVIDERFMKSVLGIDEAPYCPLAHLLNEHITQNYSFDVSQPTVKVGDFDNYLRKKVLPLLSESVAASSSPSQMFDVFYDTLKNVRRQGMISDTPYKNVYDFSLRTSDHRTLYGRFKLIADDSKSTNMQILTNDRNLNIIRTNGLEVSLRYSRG